VAPEPASAAPSSFSAERAMRHLEAIATETRFAGAPNHARTREYIQAELRDLRLQPQLQRTAVVNRFSEDADPEAGTVTNIVARIPGTDSSGAIALNAHYDSGPAGPGASDCGSCVAAVLEAARAVRAGEPLRNDVLLIFSDAEENGDLGAAFADRSPLMRDIDVVLNWETAGSHGPSMLLGANSSWLVGEVLAGAPGARTYSVLPSLFRGLFKARS
jgi:acetylornithine deacetylase/succinyl-diaminopimelate desuccinylase-like protein